MAARGLGVADASLMVVGSILGAGIFLVSGFVAENVRSPAGFFGVWIAGGLVALAGALCNGELGALFPVGGGEYVYLREAYGAPVGFLSGWTSFWIGFPGSIATLAWGFGHTVALLAGDARAGLPIALGAVALLTAVDATGLEPGKWLQNVLSSAKLVVFALLFALGILLPRGGPSHFVPFVAPERPGALAIALLPVFFAYSGWNVATYMAGEMREPQKSLPRALFYGTIACVAVYLAVNVAYLRGLSLDEMRGEANVAHAAMTRFSVAAARLVLAPLVAVSLLSSLQATVLAGPRIYEAMARDRLFFAVLGRVTPRSGSPAVATWTQGAVACALLLTNTFERLLTFTTFAILVFSTLTVAGVVVLRFRRPDAPRAFRTPGYPFVPALFVAANLWVALNVIASGAREALAGLAIVAAGLPAYVLFVKMGRPGLKPGAGKDRVGKPA
ncbi:MAG TPA: amino acid permease [Polyangiaceae bacterium]|nr:amino acid permease [Polyangiaceae bacterium]